VCFSPQADLVGGTVIAAIGIDAVRHVGKRRDHLLLAALPLLLGFHQIVEAFVWWGQQGHVPPGLAEVALWVYLLIAFVVLPIYVPLAVLALEPTGRHRRLMIPFVVLGAAVGITLLAAMVRGPIGVKARPYHLAYSLHTGDTLLLISLYVVAVCGALLLSGYRDVAIFGAVNLFAIIVIAALTVDGFASVWCGWAAITSGAIALHMRFSKPHAGAPFAFG
jgi:hypothetical protein